MHSLNLEFGKVRRGFSCERCGDCCYGNSRRFGVKLFYQEVERIQRYLSRKSREEVEEFAWDYLTHAGLPQLIGDEQFLRHFKSELEDFFNAVGRSFNGKDFFVEYYVLRSYKSGRCLFFNPLNNTCFIHDVKPLTCRFFPYYAEINLKNGRIEFKEHSTACHGLRSQSEKNLLELGSLGIELLRTITEHYSTLAGFLPEEEASKIKKLFVDELVYRKSSEEEARRELEKMLGSRASRVVDYFLENGLIAASESYRRRIAPGGFEPPSQDPESRMIDHYTTGL